MKDFLLMIFLFVVFIVTTEARKERYRVTDFGNNFKIKSPYGDHVYIGDIGISNMRSYQFEIPIEDLKNHMNGNEGLAGNNSKKEDKSLEYIESEEELILQANLLYSQGKFDQSLKYIDEAIKRNGKNSRAWIMKGSLMHLKGQSNLAKMYWKKALKLDPDNKQIQKLLEE